jgi:hypothetical protein
MTSITDAPEPPIHLILEVVGAMTGMSVARLQSARREAELSVARFVGYWLASKLTTLSLAAIGVEMGGRDPTTIQHGIRRMDELVANKAELRERLEHAISTIRVLSAKGASLRLVTRPDAQGTAERILAAAQAERAAVTASTRDIVAMALRIVQLTRACELAADHLAADEAGEPSQHDDLVETLAALGFLTIKEEQAHAS